MRILFTITIKWGSVNRAVTQFCLHYLFFDTLLTESPQLDNSRKP